MLTDLKNSNLRAFSRNTYIDLQPDRTGRCEPTFPSLVTRPTWISTRTGAPVPLDDPQRSGKIHEDFPARIEEGLFITKHDALLGDFPR